MRAGRILIVLFVIILLAVAAFLLWRARPSTEPALPASNQSAAAPGPEAPKPAATAEPVDLGAVLGFDRLAGCEPSPALAAILERMVRIDPRTYESRRGGPIGVPGYDRPITPTFERTRHIEGGADMREVEADLNLVGRWHGLAVTGIRRYFHEESDVSAFAILFAEPPERVRETLVRNGFRLLPVGEFRETEEDEAISTSVGVERIDRGAALTCTTG